MTHTKTYNKLWLRVSIFHKHIHSYNAMHRFYALRSGDNSEFPTFFRRDSGNQPLAEIAQMSMILKITNLKFF